MALVSNCEEAVRERHNEQKAREFRFQTRCNRLFVFWATYAKRKTIVNFTLQRESEYNAN